SDCPSTILTGKVPILPFPPTINLVGKRRMTCDGRYVCEKGADVLSFFGLNDIVKLRISCIEPLHSTLKKSPNFGFLWLVSERLKLTNKRAHPLPCRLSEVRMGEWRVLIPPGEGLLFQQGLPIETAHSIFVALLLGREACLTRFAH